MLRTLILFSGALAFGGRFMAEDTGGGDGGGDAAPADDTASGDHTDPPKLDPCPFCGTADPDDAGEQVTCTHCSAVGPIAGSGMDKYGAWNTRAGDAPAEDPAPADAPPADPAADAGKFPTLAKAREGFVAIAGKAKRLHAGFKQAVAAQKKAEALNATLAASAKAAIADKATAEAALSAEKTAHASYKAGEGRRVNAAALLVAQSQGNIPPVKAEVDTNANGGKKPVAASNLTGLERATAAHTAARTK